MDSSLKDVKSASGGAAESSKKRYCYYFKLGSAAFLVGVNFLRVLFSLAHLLYYRLFNGLDRELGCL